jgi:long-chain fatty acid transport protein
MSLFSRSSLVGLYFAPLLIAPAFVHAGATDIPQQGARASGQAEAFAAQADDPSAIWHNPAGLTQLHGTYLQDGGTFIFPIWSFHPADGGESQSMRMPSVLPQVYIVSDLGTENLRVGFGANNVFGLSEEWKNSGQLNTQVTQAHLFCYNFAPSIAYKFNDHLSLGVDLNVYWGDLELSKHVDVGAPGSPQAYFHFRGQDAAIGATPAVMWKINDQNQIGAVYRSPFDFGFSGDARLKMHGMNEVGPSHSHVYLNMPQMATIAYAMRPIKPLKLEADVVWTDWHATKDTVLTSTNPAFRQTIKDNWMSGFSFRVGAQYDLTKKLALRAGYAFGQNAVPSSTFSPLVPDSNYHLGSVGFQYALNDSITLDAAYQYIYREKRHIAHNVDPAVDGTWSNQFNEVMFSATIKL